MSQDRTPAHLRGIATAFEFSGAGFGRTHTLSGIEIDDTGLEALAGDSIPQGTAISLGFQDPQQVATRGAVTWCEHCEAGYRLVVSFIDEGKSPAYQESYRRWGHTKRQPAYKGEWHAQEHA